MITYNIWSISSIFLLKIIVITAEKESYENYQLWRVDTRQNITKEFLEKVSKEAGASHVVPIYFGPVLTMASIRKQLNKDVWNRDLTTIDFILNPNMTSSWAEFLRTQNINYKVLIKNIEENVKRIGLVNNESGRRAGEMSWTSYPKSLKDIYTYLAKVAASNSEDCTLSVVGTTAHKREIKMLKLSKGSGSSHAILIEAGMHARDWTSIVSVLYFIENIARNFSKQPSYITDNDWYIIPVINPDGYEYTLRKDRFWKKNRRLFSGPCDGVDINRNFDYYWCQKGGSYDICSPRFCGIEAFSEAESSVIKDLITSRYFMSYISVRSHGRRILFPWASTTKPTKDIKDHIDVSHKMAEAMHAVDHETYRAGSVARSGDETGTGMALDWTYSQGVTYSFIIETRGEGIGGFFLEPNHLNMACKEVFEGLIKLASLL